MAYNILILLIKQPFLVELPKVDQCLGTTFFNDIVVFFFQLPLYYSFRTHTCMKASSARRLRSQAKVLISTIGVEPMIDFIFKLNAILPNWPSGTHWTYAQIAEATDRSIPHVIQYLGEGLNKEVDVSGTITTDEVATAVDLLSKKMRPQIEAREKHLQELGKKAAEHYERMMEKVRILMASNNGHAAYRTITYFAGQFENTLPKSLLITAASDAVRIGIKSGANIQELGRWLQKAVQAAMAAKNREGIEEALDLMDAYGEYFLMEGSGKGPLLLGNMLASLEEPSARFELWEQYKNLVGQLYPA